MRKVRLMPWNILVVPVHLEGRGGGVTRVGGF